MAWVWSITKGLFTASVASNGTNPKDTDARVSISRRGGEQMIIPVAEIKDLVALLRDVKRGRRKE